MTPVVTGIALLSGRDSRGRSHLTGGSARSGQVAFEGVVHHHAIGAESPPEGADGPLHTFDPALGKAVAIALVVKLNYLFSQRALQVFSIAGVVDAGIRMGSANPNGEAVHAVVGLGPPAIEDR